MNESLPYTTQGSGGVRISFIHLQYPLPSQWSLHRDAGSQLLALFTHQAEITTADDGNPLQPAGLKCALLVGPVSGMTGRLPVPCSLQTAAAREVLSSPILVAGFDSQIAINCHHSL